MQTPVTQAASERKKEKLTKGPYVIHAQKDKGGVQKAKG